MEGEVTVIALAGGPDSATALDLREYLEQPVPGRGPVPLDLNRVSCLPGAGLRVLLVACRQAERNGARVALAGVPAEARGEHPDRTGILTVSCHQAIAPFRYMRLVIEYIIDIMNP